MHRVSSGQSSRSACGRGAGTQRAARLVGLMASGECYCGETQQQGITMAVATHVHTRRERSNEEFVQQQQRPAQTDAFPNHVRKRGACTSSWGLPSPHATLRRRSHWLSPDNRTPILALRLDTPISTSTALPSARRWCGWRFRCFSFHTHRDLSVCQIYLSSSSTVTGCCTRCFRSPAPSPLLPLQNSTHENARERHPDLGHSVRINFTIDERLYLGRVYKLPSAGLPIVCLVYFAPA